MQKKIIKEQKGFTVIEVLIALAILALIIVPINLMFKHAFDSWTNNSTFIEEQDNLRYAMDYLVEEIKSTPNSAIILDGNSDGSLNIDIYGVSYTGSTQIELNGITYQLDPDTKQLLRDTEILTDRIKNIFFEFDSTSKLYTITLIGESNKVVQTKVKSRL